MYALISKCKFSHDSAFLTQVDKLAIQSTLAIRILMPQTVRSFSQLMLLFAVGQLLCGSSFAEVSVIFDTDIMGDVDDVGAVAVLHALADKGEARILAMGVSAKHPDCAPCLDALNTYFGRPDIPIGVVKGKAFMRDSKYNSQIAREFPHDLPVSEEIPDAAQLYRRILAKQPDRSVVVISVGQLTNMRNLLYTVSDQSSPLDGIALVKKKVKTWVCMGGKFPQGKEANFVNDGAAAADAVAHWPTPIVFTGFEVGVKILTGAGLQTLLNDSPVRRAFVLYNGLKDRQSWDQTAVIYGVRGRTSDLWDIESGGYCHVFPDGKNQWLTSNKAHAYLVEKMPPEEIAVQIENLMKHQPSSLSP